MIKIPITSPYTAVASASAHPSSNAFVILPSASGCLAMASTALDVAIPIPIPAPIPVRTAIHAPIAINVDMIFSPLIIIYLFLIPSLPS